MAWWWFVGSPGVASSSRPRYHSSGVGGALRRSAVALPRWACSVGTPLSGRCAAPGACDIFTRPRHIIPQRAPGRCASVGAPTEGPLQSPVTARVVVRQRRCSGPACEPGQRLRGREPIFSLPHTNSWRKKSLGGVEPPLAGGPTPGSPRDCEGEAQAPPPPQDPQWARWGLRLAKPSRQQRASGVTAVSYRCEPRASFPVRPGRALGFVSCRPLHGGPLCS